MSRTKPGDVEAHRKKRVGSEYRVRRRWKMTPQGAKGGACDVKDSRAPQSLESPQHQPYDVSKTERKRIRRRVKRRGKQDAKQEMRNQ